MDNRKKKPYTQKKTGRCVQQISEPEMNCQPLKPVHTITKVRPAYIQFTNYTQQSSYDTI